MATARTAAPDIPMLWIHQLQQGKGGDPLGNIRNVITALEQSPELNGLIGLNSSRIIVADGQPVEYGEILALIE